MVRCVVAVTIVASCAIVVAEPPWITTDDFDEVHVVLADDATESEALAARRFRIRWSEVTGFEPSIGADAISGAVNVHIGGAARAANPRIIDDYSLGADEFAVRTVSDEAGRHLLLVGGNDRGTLYAEWEFFARAMGAQAMGPAGIVWPDAPPDAIPQLNVQYAPPFRYRDTNFTIYLEQPWLANVNRLNGQWTALPDAMGGHIGFVNGIHSFGHTFHEFVNPDAYFDQHPEYFAEIEGKRRKWAQLCLTNKNVLAITIDRARELLRVAPPHQRILSVSQEDYPGFASWCTCAECRAVDEAEGSHSGSLIRFVNAVAAAIEDDFPDALIDTFAYMHTREPPRLTRPRDNVLVRVCSIEADFGRPLSDWRSERNRAFMRDLREWRRIGTHVWVWDYTQNWWAFPAPHPNEHVLQPNLTAFARIGLDGVFEQATRWRTAGDMEPLKAYLVGRGLSEPEFSWEAAYAEFLNAYYGPAAPYIDAYRRLLRDRLRESGAPLRFFNDLDWIDADTVEAADAIFARAFDAAQHEPYADRVGEAYVSAQFAALVCPPRVYRTRDAYVFTRPASPTVDEFRAMLAERDATHLNDYPLTVLDAMLPEGTPPRYQVAPIERLENERFEVWVVPARSGAVVRWRERATGRDWLRGFDDMRSDGGRIQDWADTSPFPTAKPRPVERTYTMIERTDDALTVEVTLEEGLHIARRMAVTEDGLAIEVTLTNTGNAPIELKFGVGANFSERGLLRPSVWTRVDTGWSKNRWETDVEAELLRLTADADAFALRYLRAGRTILIEPGNGVGKTNIARRTEGESVVIVPAMEPGPLAPGERRTQSVVYRIADAAPKRLD